MPTIQSIFRYPIKSCGGENLHTATVMNYGLEHDRRYMLVKPDGAFLSQRDYPKLGLIRTKIDHGVLRWHADGADSMSLRLTDFPGITQTVQVHGLEFRAVCMSNTYSAWFSNYLGIDCRMVGVPDELMRERDIKVRGESFKMHLLCHDSSSIHLVTAASLQDLGQRARANDKSIESPFNALRVRPNLILIETERPDEEKDWDTIWMHHEVLLKVRKQTERCGVVDVDPRTSIPRHGKESVLGTIAGFSRDTENKPCFGIHLIPVSTGIISVGDDASPN